MPSFYRQRITDSHGHTGTVAMPINPAATVGQKDALRAAIAGVNLGTQGDSYVTDRTPHVAGSDAKAVDDGAVKFNVYRVRVQEAMFNKVVSFSIPCADNALAGGDTDLDLASTEGAALVAAVEAAFQSEYGSAGTVLSITFEAA